MQKCQRCKRPTKVVRKDPKHGEKEWLCNKCFEKDTGQKLKK